VPEIGLLVVRPAPGVSVNRALRSVEKLPGVASAEPEVRSRPRALPDDPALHEPEPAPGTQPGTALQWAPAREMFAAAWSIERGARARVGVIDTGIDGTHPDLAGKIRSATIPDEDGSDPPATSDQDGHGTHVASLACANTNNGAGIAGAGYGCRLVIEKIDFSDGSIAAAIVDAAKRRVQALNMSFGSDGRRSAPAATRRALLYAVHRGVVLVAAASDGGSKSKPARQQGDPANALQPSGTGPHLGSGLGLSVTAADFHDKRADYAGAGTQISLAAYGTYDANRPLNPLQRTPAGILGAYPAGHTVRDGFGVQGLGCSCRTTVHGQPYAYLEGTSMAAPQVAGAAALMRTLNPDLGPLDVVRLLKRTARRHGGWNADLGWGILDAGAALRAAQQTDRRRPASRLRAGKVRGGSVPLLWVGVDRSPRGIVSSGIDHFDVFVTRDGGRRRLIARTRQHTLRWRLRSGHFYAFFTEAVDRAHNRERQPSRAGAHVYVPRP
jgi:subtilisin family serine protease